MSKKEDIILKKQEFIDSLKNLNAKAIRQLLRLNILNHFKENEDDDFCPLQVALQFFNSTFEADFRAKQRLCDNYKEIMKLLLQHGADVNKVVEGKTVLYDQILELEVFYTRCNAQVFNLLIDNGAKLIDYDFYKPYYDIMMKDCFCRNKGSFWLMKKIVLHGIYTLQEEEYETNLLSKKGKRLVKRLPIVFLLYCFKRREVEAML